MKRRSFIKKMALATGGVLAAPYILPSGRLFATTNPPLAEHVVLVLFAGGVRQQESVQQRYLSDSQKLNIEGNIMYNMLEGDAPTLKVAYGTTLPGGQKGGQPISKVLPTSLQKQGTLFKELRFSKGSTGHYNGLATAVSGNYSVTQGLKQRPLHPTIFEYARRFGGLKATDTWFVGNGISGSIPLLNHSNYDGFGERYGANFIAPIVTFGAEKYIKGFKIYHPDDELDPIHKMQTFLNQSFRLQGSHLETLGNTEQERENIKDFIRKTFDRLDKQQIAFPPVTDNGDNITIGFATEVLKYFKPKLTVINLNDVDVCHGNFTTYLGALHRADHGVGHLWDVIQTQIPEMSGKTAMLIIPECGRNLDHNPITDENDWFAYDHSDQNSRRIFSMMVGPGIPSNLTIGSEGNPVGDSSDIIPTIAELLGFKNDVLSQGLIDPVAKSFFDQI